MRTNPRFLYRAAIDTEHDSFQEPTRAVAQTIQPRAARPANFTGSFAEKCEWMRQRQAVLKRRGRKRGVGSQGSERFGNNNAR